MELTPAAVCECEVFRGKSFPRPHVTILFTYFFFISIKKHGKIDITWVILRRHISCRDDKPDGDLWACVGASDLTKTHLSGCYSLMELGWMVWGQWSLELRGDNSLFRMVWEPNVYICVMVPFISDRMDILPASGYISSIPFIFWNRITRATFLPFTPTHQHVWSPKTEILPIQFHNCLNGVLVW